MKIPSKLLKTFNHNFFHNFETKLHNFDKNSITFKIKDESYKMLIKNIVHKKSSDIPNDVLAYIAMDSLYDSKEINKVRNTIFGYFNNLK